MWRKPCWKVETARKGSVQPADFTCYNSMQVARKVRLNMNAANPSTLHSIAPLDSGRAIGLTAGASLTGFNLPRVTQNMSRGRGDQSANKYQSPVLLNIRQSRWHVGGQTGRRHQGHLCCALPKPVTQNTGEFRSGKTAPLASCSIRQQISWPPRRISTTWSLVRSTRRPS